MTELDALAPAALRRLFAADLAVWERYDHKLLPMTFRIDPVPGGDVAELYELFKRHFGEHPGYAHFDHGFRHGIVFIMSDFRSTRGFLQTGLWSEVYIHLRGKHQIGLAGPLGGGALQALSANRLGRDFGPRERELAHFIQPRLFEITRRAARRERATAMAKALARLSESAAYALVAPDGRVVDASMAGRVVLRSATNGADAGDRIPSGWHQLHTLLQRNSPQCVFSTTVLTPTLDAVVIWLTQTGPAWVVFQPSVVAPPQLRLSDRETEVMAELAAGRTNAAIAERMRISRATVAKHCSNLFAKIGVESRFAAALFGGAT